MTNHYFIKKYLLFYGRIGTVRYAEGISTMTLYSWFKGTKKEVVFKNSLNSFSNNKIEDAHYLKNYTMWPTAKIKAILPTSESQNIYPITNAVVDNTKTDNVKEVKLEKQLTLANKISEQEVIASILAVKPELSVKKA